MPDPGPEALVAVGRIGRPRGIAGEVFLDPFTDRPERFCALERVTVEKPDGSRLPFRVVQVRRYGKRFGVKFEGIDTPEDGARLGRALVLIPRQEVYPLPEGTFYVFQIVGMRVETEAGEPVGTVTDVLSLPGSDVYVVDRGGSEVLLPAVRDLLRVDLGAGRIVVRNVEGLL